MSTEIKINREELSKKRLFVAVPMYGGMCHGMFARSMIDLGVLMNHWGVKIQLYFLFNESLITRARNYCADEFLRSDCTHLMFIDSDIGFSPQDVMAMLAMSSDDSEYHVMCGPYPKKCIAWEKIKTAVDRGFADEDPKQLDRFVGDFVFNPLGNQTSIPLNQPVEVLESGTGFMLIQRKAFELLALARPDLAYKPDHVRTDHFDGTREIMAYFMDPIDRVSKEKVYEEALRAISETASSDLLAAREQARNALATPEQGSKRLLSEDYFFCQEVRKAGAKVWLCPWMRLSHAGSYIFGGSLADLAQIGATATASPDELKNKPSKAAQLRDRRKGKK